MRAAAFLGKGPRYLLAYAGWRARRLLARARATAAWPGIEELAPAVAGRNGDGLNLEDALHSHYSGRSSPGRLADWTRRGEIAAGVPAEARLRTLAEADAVVERRFRYRGREVRFTGDIDWDAKPEGNTDWTWDLNRHHFFVVLGRAYWYSQDERYAEAFASLLAEWMESNPPAFSDPAWRSVFEAGVRVANWCWAHALFLPSRALTPARHVLLLRGIFGLARFLHSHIERHAWNNHLLLEAKALSMCGLLYPELPGASNWRQLGLNLLGAQLERQVLPDGVHSERSSLYQAIITSEILEHLTVLRLADRGERDSEYCKALVRLLGMAIFQAAITRADGTRPMLGDASRTDGHVRFDAPLGARMLLGANGIPVSVRRDESLTWLLASVGLEGELARQADAQGSTTAARSSRAFPSGGYHVLEAAARGVPLHMVFDCGAFGDSVVPGHGHADALSIDVAVGATHCLVDPGMYSAHLGAYWRNYFRGTSAHNTVVVDGMDQSILDGLRRVYRPAAARLVDWASMESFDVAAGAHAGYERLKEPVSHHREIFFRKPRYWLVVDRLEGRGSHTFELLFHLPPGAQVDLDGGGKGFVMRAAGGCGLAVLPVLTEGLEANRMEGAGDPGGGIPPQGWVAYESGIRECAPVIRHVRAQEAPAYFATVLFPLLNSQDPLPRLERLAVASNGADLVGAVSGRLHSGSGWSDVFLARKVSGPKARAEEHVASAGTLETDADLAVVTVDTGLEPQSAVLYRGNLLSFGGKLLARFSGAGLAGHFAFTLDGRRLLVESTGPVRIGASLELGGALSSAQTVLLNGKEAPVHRAGGALRIEWRG